MLKFPLGAFALLLALSCSAGVLPDRFFFFWGDLVRPERWAKFSALVQTAAAHGLNGVVLECNAENAFRWDEAKKARYREARRLCEEAGVAIIPQVWSVGYGSMFSYSQDFVETSLLRGLPYVVRNGRLVFEHEEAPIGNAGFEKVGGDGRIEGWEADEPGRVVMSSARGAHGGLRCVEFVPGAAVSRHKHARLYRKVEISPFRRYRFSAWVRQREPAPGAFRPFLRVQVCGPNGETIGSSIVTNDVEDCDAWQRYWADFYTGTNSFVRVYVGAWEREGEERPWLDEGRFWVDDVELTTLPITKVPRGAGAPFAIKNLRTGRICQKGVDYATPLPMADCRIRPDDPPVDIRVLGNGTLREGDRVRIAAALPAQARIFDKSPYGQYSACMSDPELYAYFARSAAAVEELLHPDKWMLSMDEIRAGGTCRACRARQTDMAHILGDCLTRQFRTIREVHPNAEVYVWSDMLDPVHNARDGYYACRGTFEGVWNLIPKELVIVCWWKAKRDISMPFFNRLGFRTLAGAYYDAKDLDGCREWLETCRGNDLCRGMMYTTWKDRHELLGAFGDLISEDTGR